MKNQESDIVIKNNDGSIATGDSFESFGFHSEDTGGYFDAEATHQKNLEKHFGKDYRNELYLFNEDDHNIKDIIATLKSKGVILENDNENPDAIQMIIQYEGDKYVVFTHTECANAIGLNFKISYER